MGNVLAPVVRAAGLMFLMLSFANSASAKSSDCLFEVDGQRIIDGPCQFIAHRGGSFRIFTLKGVGARIRRGSKSCRTRASFWKLEWPTRRAVPQITLGVLMPSGACWTNARVRLCAWQWGEPRYFVEAPPAAPRLNQPPDLPATDTSQIPMRVGMCVQTEIASLGSRLDGAPE